MSNDFSFLVNPDDAETARKAEISRLKGRMSMTSGAKPKDPTSVPVFGPTTQREHLELIKSLSGERDLSKSAEAEVKFEAARLEFLTYKMKGEVADPALIVSFDKYLTMYLKRDTGISAGSGAGATRSGGHGGNAHRPGIERPRG